jgi:hypothetical protein
VATLGLLLVKVTVVPPGGAGLGRLRARLTIWPGATVGIALRLTCAAVPVTWTVPVVKLGALAERVEFPEATPV